MTSTKSQWNHSINLGCEDQVILPVLEDDNDTDYGFFTENN